MALLVYWLIRELATPEGKATHQKPDSLQHLDFEGAILIFVLEYGIPQEDATY